MLSFEAVDRAFAQMVESAPDGDQRAFDYPLYSTAIWLANACTLTVRVTFRTPLLNTISTYCPGGKDSKANFPLSSIFLVQLMLL
jgi:hypothetical protein